MNYKCEICGHFYEEDEIKLLAFNDGLRCDQWDSILNGEDYWDDFRCDGLVCPIGEFLE